MDGQPRDHVDNVRVCRLHLLNEQRDQLLQLSGVTAAMASGSDEASARCLMRFAETRHKTTGCYAHPQH